MEEQQFLDILERGGALSWQNKYQLLYAEQHTSNPDLEWSGYVIDRIDTNGYQSIFKTQRLSEALDKLNELIDAELESYKTIIYGKSQ